MVNVDVILLFENLELITKLIRGRNLKGHTKKVLGRQVSSMADYLRRYLKWADKSFASSKEKPRYFVGSSSLHDLHKEV